MTFDEKRKPDERRCSICMGHEAEGPGPLVEFRGREAHRYCIPTFIREGSPSEIQEASRD